jgi:hypothetical protein
MQEYRKNMTEEDVLREKAQGVRLGKTNLGVKRSDAFRARRSEYMKHEATYRKIPVACSGGRVFPSVNALAEAFGVDKHTATSWVKGRSTSRKSDVRGLKFFTLKEVLEICL